MEDDWHLLAEEELLFCSVAHNYAKCTNVCCHKAELQPSKLCKKHFEDVSMKLGLLI